jgi:hypothetical protein
MRKATDSSSFQPIFVESGIDCLFGPFYGQISPMNLCSSAYIARIYTQNHEQIKKYKKLTDLWRATVVKYISQDRYLGSPSKEGADAIWSTKRRSR